MKKKDDLRMAASIRYDKKKDEAPRLTAKGLGILADKIIELARKHDVPIKEDPALVSILCRLDIDEEIPSELFRAIAEILAFVYSTNEQYREKLEESRL
ncbi:MAG: EscU/YscU/HrcU family type III secretion system export apparatus switch protein [Deltaproteobacteria bacterium]|nr:EscU/YscU/HrcU family type III secretion system export apparatus switch protein [Deltaproteobacteria bacterium]